jgi:hypothetical protein
MREIAGPLPCHDAEWSAYKKGRLDLPPASRVLEYWHSLARAWLHAGADPARVKLHNQDWTEAEDEYLLEHAGDKTLEAIAGYLHRSYSAVRSRLNKEHGVHARNNQGFLSAAELAKQYHCSCHRIREALKTGEMKGTFDKKRNQWLIDPADIALPEFQSLLHRPRRTHKTWPVDVGDYSQRHNLKRIVQDGRLVYVGCSS